MGNKERKSMIVNYISMILILGIFAISCLFLINIGLQVYKKVVVSNNENYELRTSLSYIATKVRQTDTLGRTYIEMKEDVPVLVLGEEVDGNVYETLIYHYNGNLCELYREEKMEYELDYGIEVMEVHGFDFEVTDDGFIKLMATNKAGDREELLLTLRTGR